MRTHGVPKWPVPNSSGGFAKAKLTPQQLGGRSSQIQAAAAACQHLNPHSAPKVQQYRSTMLQYAKCMRGHGISNFPDPDSRGHLNIGPGTDVPTNTPRFQAAFQAQACQYTFAGARGTA